MRVVYGVSNDRLAKIYESVSREGRPRISFYMMVVLACTIVTLGLLTNSSTVIIGAMLISPLMSPIIAGSLAITLGDGKLARSAFQAELSGMALTIIMAALITTFSPSQELGSEILALTKPTLFDLFIALAAGAAGAYAICFRQGGGAVLPGAAISIALMPPLSVTGIGLAMGQGSVALGGFLLFLANLAAINLSSSLIFYLAGFSSQFSLEHGVAKNVYKRLLLSMAFTILISIPLFLIMSQAIHQNKVNSIIHQVVFGKIAELKNAGIVNCGFKEETNKYYVNAVIRSSEQVNHELVKRLENSLEQYLKKPTKVNVQVLMVQEINPDLPKDLNAKEIPFLQKLKPRLTQAVNEEIVAGTNNPEETVEAVLRNKFSSFNGIKLLEYTLAYSSKEAVYDIKVLGEGEKAITVEDARSIKLALEDKLSRKVRLEIEIKHPKNQEKEES